jgi:predicted amidohydrolase YtcJ
MLPRNLLFIISLSIMLNSCLADNNADLILHNGVVYTLDESFSTVNALAIRDGLILATGTSEEILQKYHSDRHMDLQGRFVYPGLIDAHCHFTGYGQNLRNADLVGTASFEEVIEKLREHDAKYPSMWILGRGWDQNDWEVKEFPTRDKLDIAFPDKPVLLRRIDGHAAIANSVALKLAGVTRESSIEGGSLIKQDGELTGVLIDRAIGLVTRMIPGPTEQDMINALLQAQENCFAVGLTSVHEAGLPHRTITLMDSLQKAGDLRIRIYAMLSPGETNYEQYMYNGIYKTESLNVRSIKLFADGALGSRGALMLQPYSDDPGNFGLAMETDDYLMEQCRLAMKYGYQVNTHCIGDSANRWILDIYSEILGGINDRRWRIEHAQVVHRDDFHKFGDFSIIPSVQSTHATSDMYWADERIGDERMKGAYAYRDLLNQNGWIPNGSDFPVEHINPLYGFYALVARKDLEGFPEEGFQMENALTRIDALRAMTIWAARAAFEENEKGSLEAGKMADFIIAGEDLLSIPEDQIPGARILYTFLGGEMVYSHDMQ